MPMHMHAHETRTFFEPSPLSPPILTVMPVPHGVFNTIKEGPAGARAALPNPVPSMQEIFGGKKVVLFALPGAFTPTCTSNHLPRYEVLYDKFKAKGVSDIICLSVNDAFVMYQWGQHIGAKNVMLLPDGNGEFTRRMGMLVDKANKGFGMRSWRYSMLVDDGKIVKIFKEPEFGDNATVDPFVVSDADTMLAYLTGTKSEGVAKPRAFVG